MTVWLPRPRSEQPLLEEIFILYVFRLSRSRGGEPKSASGCFGQFISIDISIDAKFLNNIYQS